MWSENIDIIERVFFNLALSNNKDTYKMLMCASTLYYQIGEHILSKILTHLDANVSAIL